MKVIRRLLDDAVRVRVKVFTVHAAKSSSRNNVPQMSDDGIDKEHLPVFVPIHPPRIGRAHANHLELMPCRMEPPDPTVQRQPLIGRRAGYTDA